VPWQMGFDYTDRGGAFAASKDTVATDVREAAAASGVAAETPDQLRPTVGLDCKCYPAKRPAAMPNKMPCRRARIGASKSGWTC
jgi:hypothetical protein